MKGTCAPRVVYVLAHVRALLLIVTSTLLLLCFSLVTHVWHCRITFNERNLIQNDAFFSASLSTYKWGWHMMMLSLWGAFSVGKYWRSAKFESSKTEICFIIFLTTTSTYLLEFRWNSKISSPDEMFKVIFCWNSWRLLVCFFFGCFSHCCSFVIDALLRKERTWLQKSQGSRMESRFIW